MAYEKEFEKSVAKRLADEKWLNFDCALPFKVFPTGKRVFKTRDKRALVSFFFALGRSRWVPRVLLPSFGTLALVPDEAESAMIIELIDVRDVRARGIGRELVRRTVNYALEEGFRFVETTNCYFGAAGFWLGHGFRGKMRVFPQWERAGSELFVREWQDRIERDPDDIWVMARTDEGRRVLQRECGECILDLSDEKQRRYAFGRLGLPLPS